MTVQVTCFLFKHKMKGAKLAPKADHCFSSYGVLPPPELKLIPKKGEVSLNDPAQFYSRIARLFICSSSLCTLK